MSKNRFTTSDVRAMVRDVRSVLLGKRVSNIYNLSDKCYLLKFATPGITEKHILLLESGIRFHTTIFVRETPDFPSPFAMKLRKHIKTKRIEDIKQVGFDRVVILTFGSDEFVNHLILELYANGNVVLTNGDYEVLALLRSHQFAEDVVLKVGEVYPVGFTTNGIPSEINPNQESSHDIRNMTSNEFLTWSESILSYQNPVSTAIASTHGKKKSRPLTLRQLLLSKDSGVASLGQDILDHCLVKSGLTPNRKASELKTIDSNTISTLIHELKICDHELIHKLDQPGHCGYIVYQTTNHQSTSTSSSINQSEDSSSQNIEYLEYLPILLAQHHDKATLEFPSFNEAVDDYYGRIEGQKLQREAIQAEETAKKKIEKVKLDQLSIQKALELQQQRMELSARLLETYADEVEKVCLVIKSAMIHGMTWDGIQDMVDMEKKKGNPIALLIKSLRLDRNHVILQLKNNLSTENEENDNEDEEEEEEEEVDHDDDDDDYEKVEYEVVHNKPMKMINMFDSSSDEEDDAKSSESHPGPTTNTTATDSHHETIKPEEKVWVPQKEIKSKKNEVEEDSNLVDVEIDIMKSAHANAQSMYVNKKVAHAKELKTAAISVRVLQNVEKETLKTLEKQKLKKQLHIHRKVHWFEKFNWFITSEGYMVISGRDAQQNETLFRKYLKSGDLYVHADITGAASCIIKAKVPHQNTQSAQDSKAMVQSATPISPLVIREAGIMAVCRSSAWVAKVITSAWWVYSTQVSKSAPSGEYLTTGSFMIYGKKNYLPPMSMEMGYAILFRLDDDSVHRHLNDRKDRSNIFQGEKRMDNNDPTLQALVKNEMKLEQLEDCVESSYEMIDKEDEGEDQLNDPTNVADENELAADHEEEEEEEEGQDEEDNDDESDQVDEKEVEIQNLSIQNKKGSTSSHQDKKKAINQTTKSLKKGTETKGSSNKIMDTPLPSKESTKRKKVINSKKARRYAEQDEDDRKLAMLLLGNAMDGEKLSKKKEMNEKENKKKDLIRRQERAGIKFHKEDWDSLVELLPNAVQERMIELINEGRLKAGEIDEFEMKALSTFPSEEGLQILTIFSDGKKLDKIGNKSFYLSGIMKQYQKDLQKQTVSKITSSRVMKEDERMEGNSTGEWNIFFKNHPETEQMVIEEEVEEEVHEDDESNHIDIIQKLTGIPQSEDGLLYAVPVCGPYIALQNYKYKVKLIPGTLKRGKAIKQVMELLSYQNKNKLDERETLLIKELQDGELSAIMMNEVKLSVPGIQQVQKQRKKGRGQKV